MTRLFAFLVFLVGLALAVGYPMLAARLPAMPIGTWPVYASATGFMRIDTKLGPEDAPAQVYLDLAAAGPPEFSTDRAVLTLTVLTDGKTILATPLNFTDAVVRDDTPQTPELVYRAKAGMIETVDPATPIYAFVTGPGDADGVEFSKVNLVLEHGPQAADPRAGPIGIAVMAIGVVAFLLSFRGSDPPPNPNSQPPPPRWGRAAGDRK